MVQSAMFQAPRNAPEAKPRSVAQPAAAVYSPDHLLSLGVLIGLVCVLLFAYGNTLEQTMLKWQNAKYSHGYLIPAFTLALLWIRGSNRSPIGQIEKIGLGVLGVGAVLIGSTVVFESMPVDVARACQLFGTMAGVAGALMFVNEPISISSVPSNERWLGLGVLLGSLAARLAFTWWPILTFEMYTFLGSLLGVFLMVGGGKTFRWAWPAIGFLFFMFPLWGPLEQNMLSFLQNIATKASAYTLQTMGIVCSYSGNDMIVGGAQMLVEERCSGLRMLTIFLAMGMAIALVTDRPIWERVVLVLSAVPIALAVNVIRIVVTGICYMMAANNMYGMTRETADKVFHDAAGWVMMPIALGMLFVVYQILSHLVIEEERTGPVTLGVGLPRGPQAQR